MTSLLPRRLSTGRTRERAAPVRVGLCGLLGTGNLGNDGSMEAVLALVRDRFPDAEFGCLCSGPDEVGAGFGLSTARLNWYRGEYETATGLAVGWKLLGKIIDPFRVWAWVRRHDIVIVPGMGVLEGSLPSRPWGWPYTLLLVCLAGRISGTRVALVCVGADELARPLTRRIIVAAARLAHNRSYRDAASRDAMYAMGLAAAGTDEVVTDLAFALPIPPDEPTRGHTVGVGVMALPGGPVTPREVGPHELYVEKITAFVGWLLDHGYDVRLLTGDRADAAVAAGIRADLRSRRDDLPAERLSATSPGSLAELMSLMRPLDTIVATRYHNIVCALHLGMPTVSIGYAAKNDVLMAEMGLAFACQRTGSLDVDRLVEQFLSVRSRRDELRSRALDRDRTGMLRDHVTALVAAASGRRRVEPAG